VGISRRLVESGGCNQKRLRSRKRVGAKGGELVGDKWSQEGAIRRD
jgi:hypothetical protein